METDVHMIMLAKASLPPLPQAHHPVLYSSLAGVLVVQQFIVEQSITQRINAKFGIRCSFWCL